MTNYNRLNFISSTVLALILSITTCSCSKNDDTPTPVVIKEISQEIKDLIYLSGDEKASTVLVTVAGGPSTELATGLVDYFSENFNTTGILNVTIHQAQTLNPNIIEGNDITLADAINFNAESIENLYQVIEYFKDEGRTVYVVGFSFGAFVTQELIAKKGIDVADKYLIVSGRLDINEAFWLGLAGGRDGRFDNGITPIIETEPFEESFKRNEAKLFAGLIMNRYTMQFNAIESLSSITYIYGKTDEDVGSLTNEEVSFLESKNANILFGNGGHDEPFEGFVNQGFSQAFGIELQQ